MNGQEELTTPPISPIDEVQIVTKQRHGRQASHCRAAEVLPERSW